MTNENPIPSGWVDPPEEVKSMAESLFQLFTALCAAGFTEQQALTVVGQVLGAANGGKS